MGGEGGGIGSSHTTVTAAPPTTRKELIWCFCGTSCYSWMKTSHRGNFSRQSAIWHAQHSLLRHFLKKPETLCTRSRSRMTSVSSCLVLILFQQKKKIPSHPRKFVLFFLSYVVFVFLENISIKDNAWWEEDEQEIEAWTLLQTHC